MLTPTQKQLLSIVNLKGYGGKENILSRILSRDNGWERTSHTLYDYKNDLLGCLVECKKQADLQWLDPSKYYGLTDNEKEIRFLFIVINKAGYVDVAFSVRTGDLVERLWSSEHVRDAWEYIQKYPKDQIKSSIKTRSFYRDNRDIVNTVYERINSKEMVC
jgi:hypothetical protein